MGQTGVLTTQNINIDYPLAGLGNRILAHLIDGLILLVIALVMLIPAVFSLISQTQTGRIVGIVLFSLYGMIFLLYSLILEIYFNGQTFGKKMMKIKVIRQDGSIPTVGNYIMRWLLRLVEVYLFYGIIAIITIAASKKEQRLGDMAAGTLVISLNKPVRFQSTIYRDIPEDYTPRFPQVVMLSEKDIYIIQNVISEASRTYNAADRLSLLNKARAKVEQRLNIKPEDIANVDSLIFLKTVIADYNFYGQSRV
ncbi:MAG: RDD family protein [Prolixibacteraceae bacterium]|nr:RDD family protein [Prolixibacteraceae bacterium]